AVGPPRELDDLELAAPQLSRRFAGPLDRWLDSAPERGQGVDGDRDQTVPRRELAQFGEGRQFAVPLQAPANRGRRLQAGGPDQVAGRLSPSGTAENTAGIAREGKDVAGPSEVVRLAVGGSQRPHRGCTISSGDPGRRPVAQVDGDVKALCL